MKKRILSILLCLCMTAVLIPTTALAWTQPNNIEVNNAAYYSTGTLKEITASFNWYTASARSRLVLMTKRLRSAGEDGTNITWGDFTDLGFYGSKFSSFEEACAYDKSGDNAGVFGIISYTNESSVQMGSNNTMTISFDDGMIPLNTDRIYYIYLWTQYYGNNYPDALICAIQVQNGAVKYAAATDRNTYDENAFGNVESQTAYDVTVNSADNMTRDNSSGGEIQSDLDAAMTPVIYTADDGYYFPEDYSVDTVNGIMVRRDSKSQITVYGTPSSDATITLTAPDEVATYTVKFNANGGSGTMADMTVNVGAHATLTENAFTRAGYSFVGWNDKPDGSGTNFSDKAVVPTANAGESITLYARWVHGKVSDDAAHVSGIEADGLNEVAKAEKTDITLVVRAEAEADGDTEQDAIKASAGTTKNFGFYDIKLEKSTGGTVENTSSVIEIKLPYDFTRKTNIKVYRYHDATAEELIQLDTRAMSPYEDGKFFVNIENGCIYIYSSKFSTYSVAYDTVSYDAGRSSNTTRYTVKFDTDGGSEVSAKTITKNSKTAKPTDPTKDGFTFDGWYTDKDFTTAYDFNQPVTKNITLYAKWSEVKIDEPYDEQEIPDTECDGTSADNCASLEFDDLDVKLWYHSDADYAIDNGLMKGLTPKTFAPNANMTRAMLVTVLYRLEGEPATNRSIPFADVDMGAYYANAIIWAQQNGIVKGRSETEFAPNDNITREQIVTIMRNYAQYKEYDVSVGENTNILSYTDFDSISEYAISSMQYAVGSGLMKGKTERTLNPKDFSTRAEVAAILHRFIETNK